MGDAVDVDGDVEKLFIIDEIQGWMHLWEEDFTFGDCTGSAEFEFYQNFLWEFELSGLLNPAVTIKKTRHKRQRNRITEQQRLKKKHDAGNSMIYYKDFRIEVPRYKQYYITGPRKYAKWCTNRIIRGIKEDIIPHRPSGYRRMFDYSYCIW